MKPEWKYDVVAVNIKTQRVRLLAEGKTRDVAEAIERYAIVQRGVEEEFFSPVVRGHYKNDDQWNGNGNI